MIVPQLIYSSLLPGVRFLSIFFITVFLTKILSVEDYGLWSYFISLSGLVVTIGSLNLMYSTQIFLNDYQEHNKKNIVSSLFIFKFSLTIALSLIFNLYIFYSGIFNYETFLIAIVFIIFRVCTDFFFGILRALLLIKNQFTIFAIENISTLILILIYLNQINDYSLTVLFILATMAQLFSAVYGYITIRKYISFNTFDFVNVKKFLSTGIFLIPFSYIDLIIASFTPFIIQIYLGLTEVAFYSLAQKIALIVTVPGSILNNIYIQNYKKTLKRNDLYLQKKLNKILFLFILGILVTGIIINHLSHEIILILSSPSYLPASSLISLLIMCNIMISFISFINYFLILRKNEKFIFRTWIFMLSIYFPLTVVFINIFGIVGALYSILFIISLGFAISLKKLISSDNQI